MGLHTIDVYVNDQPLRLAYDAQVRHALLSYDARWFKLVRDGRAIVTDDEGHPVDLFGGLGDGWRLYVRLKEPPSTERAVGEER
ncbi:MAG: hypothetical protein IMX04_02150 [Candidatus Carbobacillus altaicus]|nr:hypothetical protein [Candidatus Carbobacillus altaicus]